MTSDPSARRRTASGSSDRPKGVTPEARSTDAAGSGTEQRLAIRDRFNRIADRTTSALGSFWALIASVLVVVLWGLTGPIFHFSDTWQLFINTTTTVVTFWMVFVIQNSQNRDAKAVHLKLDELIRAAEGARNAFITLENESEQVVAEKAEELAQIAAAEADAAQVRDTIAQPIEQDAAVGAASAVRSGAGSDPNTPTA